MERLRESDKMNGSVLDDNVKDKEPLASVLLLVYRNFDGIWGSLDSVFSQTYGNIELIISDDGSPEYHEYEADVKAYIEKRKRENITSVIFNHLENNVGTTKNCNIAIKIANGKYIKMLSPYDSLHDGEMIKKCVEYCEETGAEIVVGQTFVKRREIYGDVEDSIKNTPLYRFRARNGRKCILTPTTVDIKKLRKMKQSECLRLLSTWPIISTPSVFYKKDLFDRTGGYLDLSRLIEDMPYWPKLAREGVPFHFVDIIMVDYSLNGMSNGGGHSQEFKQDYARIMKNIYIKNEYRGGIFNGWLKSVRTRNVRLTNGENVCGFSRFMLFDVYVYRLYLNIKYLVFGTRI